LIFYYFSFRINYYFCDLEVVKAKAVEVKKKEVKPVIDQRDMTEEEKRKAQEEADLAHANELFGLEKSLDEISLNSREECIDYSNRLYARLNKFNVNLMINDRKYRFI
jgi:hypothetical protein